MALAPALRLAAAANVTVSLAHGPVTVTAGDRAGVTVIVTPSQLETESLSPAAALAVPGPLGVAVTVTGGAERRSDSTVGSTRDD